MRDKTQRTKVSSKRGNHQLNAVHLVGFKGFCLPVMVQLLLLSHCAAALQHCCVCVCANGHSSQHPAVVL